MKFSNIRSRRKTGLRYLRFGNCFNQDLAKTVLPSSLRHISFGKKYNVNLSGVVFPKDLESITFGADRYLAGAKTVTCHEF